MALYNNFVIILNIKVAAEAGKLLRTIYIDFFYVFSLI